MSTPFHTHGFGRALNTIGAWTLGLLWFLPLLYAFWTAFHPSAYAVRFDLLAPLTLENFVKAWSAAPFARYFLNTFILVTMILAASSCFALSPPTPSRASGSSAAIWYSCWFWCS